MKGLELLFKIEEKNLSSKQDAIVLATHCFLINDGFQCVGLGDEWTDDQASNSELLPTNWNADNNVYTLRYQNRGGEKFLLKVVKSDVHLLINLLEISNQQASGTAVILDDYINDVSDYKTTFKNIDTFAQKLHDDFLVKEKTEKGTETMSGNSTEQVVILNPPRRLPRYEDPDWSDLREPMRGGPASGYGRSDLDPLARGSGMIFNPLANRNRNEPDLGIGGPRLPRGAIPPGARFDPFGPPNPDFQNPGRSNPGMFGPPPDYNDMFM